MGIAKEIMKEFLPPPMKVFNREISAVKDIIVQQGEELEHYIQENEEHLQYLLNDHAKELLQHAESQAEFFLSTKNNTEQLRLLVEKQGEKLRTITALMTEIQKAMLSEFEKANSAVIQCIAQLDDQVKKQENALQELQQRVNAISSAQEPKIYYVCDYEAQFIAENGFYEIRECPDFLARYKALTCGLDRESIDTVNQILSRQMEIKGHATGDHIDLFTSTEKAIIADQRAGFYSAIPQVAPGIYACGKYLMASSNPGMGFMETTIFEDFAGFKKLRYPQKIYDKDILDIGAFIGDSTVVLAQFTNKNIYAFEPGYGNFIALKKTLELNECTNAIPVRVGVGAHSGMAQASACLSMGVVLEEAGDKNAPEEAVQMISVDEFVTQHNLQVGLIKVDVEGYEREFLKGAEKTIKEQRPALLLSMYHSAEDFFGLKPLLESWRLGYTFQVHKEVNEHIHFDTMLIAEVRDN